MEPTITDICQECGAIYPWSSQSEHVALECITVQLEAAHQIIHDQIVTQLEARDYLDPAEYLELQRLREML